MISLKEILASRKMRVLVMWCLAWLAGHLVVPLASWAGMNPGLVDGLRTAIDDFTMKSAALAGTLVFSIAHEDNGGKSAVVLSPPANATVVTTVTPAPAPVAQPVIHEVVP